ncbi:MAG: hypothetical protein JWQ84_706 [Mucilaginibacter sp.]|nr:hypothetical protein [Mucilaginibacter sp.]
MYLPAHHKRKNTLKILMRFALALSKEKARVLYYLQTGHYYLTFLGSGFDFNSYSFGGSAPKRFFTK